MIYGDWQCFCWQCNGDPPPWMEIDPDDTPCMHGQAPDRVCTFGQICSCGCQVCRPGAVEEQP